MTRISPITKEEANQNITQIYSGLEKKMGRVLNIFQNMGNSEAALKGYLGLSEAASQTSLSPKLREQLALVVGQTNDCQYCLSAHTVSAKLAGLQEKDILESRLGHSQDKKTEAILTFAKTIVERRAQVSDQDIEKLKSAGISDQEIVEIILVVVLNIFTNYFNHITDPQIDFPFAPKIN
ncbi:carboxymuconolactone decarboxylase family protein [Candidatus Protochlamydia amoebophila]|uniref:Carboxymuconolactone decarboxylase-like domain-containing protein n=1 Tax=Protochlamydia amoebophila (strain UWE25) TaxID=264201 RepID=Q6MC27_PARUW|nr:carboxymuconolactone decarboxylase family protein [Candidatus Protochlamydia amoebophila]CAF23872.1 unnamed protein product [Candidatus Protochlamydia amoebophila UWE25]